MIAKKSVQNARREIDVLLSLDPAVTDPALDALADPGGRAVRAAALETDSSRRSGALTWYAVDRRQRRSRRLLAGAAVAALAFGASVLAPQWLGGSAMAWSAEPRALSVTEARDAEAECLAAYQRNAEALQGPEAQPFDVSTLRPVVTEARGDTAMVMFSDGAVSPSDSVCFVQDNRVVGFNTGDPSNSLPASISTIKISTGYSFDEDVQDGRGSFGGLAGHVGADVVGVVLRTRARGSVVATVHGGYFAAWWPSTDDLSNHQDTTALDGAEVTLRDGQIRQVPVSELMQDRDPSRS